MADSSKPSVFERRILAMIHGYTKGMPSTVASTLVGGTSMTTEQVLAKLNAIEITLSAVTVAKTSLKAAIAERSREMLGDRKFLENLVTGLKAQFGYSPEQLNEFGVTLPKAKTKLTSDQRTIATAKLRATRALRGTRGKKQRETITLGGQASVQVLGPNGQPFSGSAPTAPAAPTSTVPTAPGHL